VSLYALITGPEETIGSGVVHQEVLPSRIAAGVGLAVYRLDFAKRSRLELEGFFLMGLSIESDPEPVPIPGSSAPAPRSLAARAASSTPTHRASCGSSTAQASRAPPRSARPA
jgi:hypothetical protein